MTNTNISALISTATQMRSGGAFPNYIEYIRFPEYRNFAADAKISFDFPLTVFVGRNGTGKTAALQALFGAPHGNSVGKYWFSTYVDPIYEAALEPGKRRSFEGDRNAFIYAYKATSGDIVEVLKTRILYKNNPDYWEPSRPIAKYGMKTLAGRGRNPAINKHVIYLNFRYMLTAFDLSFYFTDLNKIKASLRTRQSITTIQDYLRYKSRYLKNALAKRNIRPIKRNALSRPASTLSPDEISYINRITGKDYIGGRLIEHRFYERWGTSVLFETAHRTYSEAFAGSGETAVVRLVHTVYNAPEGSLVLLDEPEISLHPGAQEELITFLLDQIKRKKLQVVLSTHSPAIVRQLPRTAIKVFSTRQDGAVEINENWTSSEAYFELGHFHHKKINILVEDKLAQEVLEEAIATMPGANLAVFNVEFFPGGQSAMKQDITYFMRDKSANKYIFFDGDQKPDEEHVDPINIPISQHTEEFLDTTIKKQTKGQKISLVTDGGITGGNKSQKINHMLQYLAYYRRYVFYLPFNTPEDAIWSSDVALGLLRWHYGDEAGIGHGAIQADEEIARIESLPTTKEKFARLAEVVELPIAHLHRSFIRKWRDKKDDAWENIRDLIEAIKKSDA